MKKTLASSSNLENVKNEDLITINLNINIEENFKAPDSSSSGASVEQKMVSWDQYASTGTEFTKKHNSMNFDLDSSFGVSSEYGADSINGTSMNIKTNDILTLDDDINTYAVSINHNSSSVVKVEANICIYHDDHNIFYGMEYSQTNHKATQPSKIGLKINTITF